MTKGNSDDKSIAAPLAIGFLGSQRRGTDPRALAGAFRSRGHLLFERSYDEFLPQQWRHPVLKIARRLLRPRYAADYNRAVGELADPESLDFLLVFKGMLLAPATLLHFREAAIPCYLFYPDVSFHDHGPNLPACLPHYDHIFTTKPFHLESPPPGLPADVFTLVNHGADPEVHRPVCPSPGLAATYRCDVSFVGCWSPKKERYLVRLMEALPALDLRLWGPGWERAAPKVRRAWQGRGAWGDEVAAIYATSRINLGLLSEAGTATPKGDQTTARTWQIPAAGGFLLHEGTDEFVRHFLPGAEAGVFLDPDSLVREVARYLSDSDRREAIRKAGLERARSSDYTYLPAAKAIETYHRGRAAGNQPSRT